MKISLLDKIMLANVLPKEGNIRTLVIVRDINKKVDLTQEDIKEYEIKPLPDGRLAWNDKGTKAEFEIEFTELEKNEIKLALKKLDNENKLTIDHLSLVDAFKVSSEA